MVKHVLKKGAYELVDYEGMALVEPRNGLYLKKYYAWSSAKATYCILLYHFAWLGLFLTVIGFVISFHVFWQMSMESSTYIGFTDGASHHIQHLAFAAWVIYTPIVQVLSSGGICLRPSSNNVAEYIAIIELLRDAISHGVHSLEVRLDS